MPDAQLLARARTYDTQALAEIYDCYAESIYRYLYRYLGDAALAEDLTSEVFVRLLQALGSRRAPRERLQGWLYRVAHNLAMDWFRREGKASPVPIDEGMVAGVESPTKLLEERQLQDRLRAAIRALTPDQQQVILLRFGEGLGIGEVAALLNKSQGAVKILQHRAVKRLRTLLEQEGN
jgi:RNA polymerase sigma-70 factor (ECF subfamily)